MPFSKNEAEEVLRAAAGQSKPEVGDKFVWAEKGWTFIPNIFIGGGIDALATVPYVFAATTTPRLLGESLIGDADLFDTVAFERVLHAFRVDDGAGTHEPNGEFIIPLKISGFFRLIFNLEYTGSNNSTIAVQFGWRKAEVGSTPILSPALFINTKNSADHLSVTDLGEVPGGGLVGVYVSTVTGVTSLTISAASLTLEFAGQ